MRVVALCGLHEVGKSFIADKLTRWDWISIKKRIALRDIYIKSFPNENPVLWEEWYRQQYAMYGGKHMMSLVFNHIEKTEKISHGSTVVLDAVHNLQEWNFIRESFPARLVLIVAPREIRCRRHKVGENLSLLDHNRIQYIHELQGNQVDCLYAHADWCICNVGDNRSLDDHLEALVAFVTNII